ncbi:MAG: sigma-54 dependent transcriptional regulator [Bacteroidota bacterium]
MNKKILIIDDDLDMCGMLDRYFSKYQLDVTCAVSGKKGLEELEKTQPDIVISDFRLGDTDGKELLIKIKSLHPHLPVIIITGYSDIKTAVEVMKQGAYDYVTKPLLPAEILATIHKAIEAASHQSDINTPLQPDEAPILPIYKRKINNTKYIFGESHQFKQILEQMDLVAPTNYSVIISGESGSGKEAIAQEIHARSKRKNEPFIAIDCGALSNELAASELFGHEKGSFTGASNQKIGSMELANGGTVFLDEIGNLSYDSQASLLRVVQERKLRRVGGNVDIDLDIRIIVASNDRLADAAKKGRFREDLYYRFNEFSINVPPLRERKNDILTFAHFFLEQSNVELDKQVTEFLPEVEKIFLDYPWPGNLRELKNIVKRAALLANGAAIDISTLPFELVNNNRAESQPEHTGYGRRTGENNGHSEGAFSENHQERATGQVNYVHREASKNSKYTLKTVGIDAEYEMIVEALKKSNFNKSKAAKLLNVDRKTLYNKMKLHSEFNGG